MSVLEEETRSWNGEDMLALNYINTGWGQIRSEINDAMIVIDGVLKRCLGLTVMGRGTCTGPWALSVRTIITSSPSCVC